MHASAEFVHMADQQGSLVLRILDAAGWRTVYTVPDDLLVFVRHHAHLIVCQIQRLRKAPAASQIMAGAIGIKQAFRWPRI